MCASTRAISAFSASIRSCSSSIDSGSRSCRASATKGSSGLLGKRSSRSTVRIVDPCGRGVNKRGALPSVPTSMMAVVAPQPDGAEELALVERPVPKPGPGEVLVKVAAAGVNRPDILQRRGLYPPPPGAPDILGLEIAGEVVEAGEGAGELLGQDLCALVPGGGYAQYCVAPVGTCLPVPEAISLIE